MRIDHIAFRCSNRDKTINFFIETMGYKISTKYLEGFRVDFDDKTFAKCSVLEPESIDEFRVNKLPWIYCNPFIHEVEYHFPPEIFVSEGSPGSIVDQWVQKNGTGLHHIALLVDSVEETKKEWEEKKYAEFTTENPTKCPGLTQIFTKPSELTGVVWELIERDVNEDGFCVDNVRNLMESTVSKKD